jgi:mannose-1-phosphate guanylyltransferase
MRALLLSAGLGTRLRPLTEFLPKCLVPINGRPLLDFWIDSLVSQGIDEILINTHYHADLVADYLKRSSWHGRVDLVHERKLLGTGGTLLANHDFFGEQPVLLAHAVNLTRFDCQDFLRAHHARPAKAALTMMLFCTPSPSTCGIVELDGDGIVQAFHEKVPDPPGNLANAAVYILGPEVISYMATLGKEEIDFSTEVIPHFLGRIFTFDKVEYHRDIGNVQSWSEAQRDFGMPAASPGNERAWNQLMTGLDADLPELMQRLANTKA